MIYIIGGAPRVGKSIVAKRIAESGHATFISTDDVCNRVSKELSEEERKIRFPLPGFSSKASENALTPEQRMELSIISAKSLESEIDRLISNANSRGESLVIEGVHFLPEHVRDLRTQYGAKNMKTLFVGLTNVDAAVDGIVKNTSPDNWMRESDQHVIRQVAEFVVAFSHFIKEESERNYLPYQERTTDFEGDMKRLYEQVLNDSEIRL